MPSTAELMRRAREIATRTGRGDFAHLATPLTEAPAIAPAGRVVIGDPPIAVRDGLRLELRILLAARTKKNSTTLGVRQSAGYRRFRNWVIAQLAPHRAALGLPMPEFRYNLAAVFFTENDQADTGGLLQGLTDALQDAGVVTNDRQCWTFNGTDQHFDPMLPRIELALTPIGPMPAHSSTREPPRERSLKRRRRA